MFYGWYIVASCCLISCYATGVVGLGFTAFVDPISKEFGWSYTQISLASSLRGLEAGLLVLVVGVLMDRWGPRPVIFCGSVLMALGIAALSRVNSLLFFYVTVVIIATGFSTMTSSMLMAASANWFRRKSSLAMGITASGSALAGLLIPLITLLVERYGWRQALVFCAVGTLLIPLPLSLVLKHKPENIGLNPDGECRHEPGSEKSNDSMPEENSFSAREALASKPFWFISIASMILTMPITALGTHIMPYLATVGIDRVTASIIAGATPLVTIVGRISFGWIGDRMDKIILFTLALVLMSGGLLLLPMISADRKLPIAFFVCFFGIGWGGSVPMISGLLRTYFGLDRLASIMGFSLSVMFAGSLVGAPVAGWVFDRWGWYEPVWYTMAALVGITAIVVPFLLKAHILTNIRH
ncbi:MAG: MFS transporter [SAR324 cluster bacterium]|nr:MFS transporter [SAR324 cluster bacterium]